MFLERIDSMAGPFCQINGWAVGGAVSRVAEDATAVGDRDLGFEISLTAALRPHAEGVYANLISDEGPAGVEYAYGRRLHRLRDIQARHDPENFFRMNANIAPSRRLGREDR